MTIAFPYIVFYIIVFLVSIHTVKSSSKLDAIVLVALLFIFFWGFRGLLSSDWVQYYPAFSKIKPFSIDNDNVLEKNFLLVPWEKGFVIYYTILKTVCNNYFVFQAIDYILFFSILIVFLLDNQNIENICMSLIFFILFYGEHFSCNFLRNGKAYIFFLYSIKYIKTHEFKKYLFFNLLGTFFHVSALFFIPVYFLNKIKLSKMILVFLFLLGNIIFILDISVTKETLHFIASLGNNRICKMIAFYLERTSYSKSFGLSIGFIERFFTFIIVFLFQNKLESKNEENHLYINLIYLYLLINLFCADFYVIIERFSILYICGYWIIYPKIYRMLSKENKMLFLFLLFMYGFLKLFSGHQDITFFYENVLFNHNDYEGRLRLISGL